MSFAVRDLAHAMFTPGRVGRRASALALALTLLITLPTAAAFHGTNTLTNPGKAWMTMGAWGGWATYSASWNVVTEHSEGITEYEVSNLDFEVIAEKGQDCFTSEFCEGWMFSGKAQFLNSSGGVVQTVTNPPFVNCTSGAYNVHDFHVQRCHTGAVSVPISATLIKFTWNTAFQRHDDNWFSWPTVTKTVAI